MVNGLATCLTALVTPFLPAAGTSQLVMKDPSTLELALIGAGTLAAYSVAKRRSSPGKDKVAAVVATDNAVCRFEQQAQEPSRGAA